MAIFNNMSITNKGQILYAKAQAGTKLNFTKIMVGSGQIENRNPATLLALLEPKFSIGIQSITPNTELKTATISATINNSEVTEAVYICEIGLYAEDPDDGEILYAYGSAGTYGDYYAPASQGAYSWNYQINAAIGNAANVTIELSNLSYDYAVINSNTTFTVIGGGNQKEINKSIDNKISELTRKSNDLTSDSYPIVEATGTNAYIGASARIKAVGKGTRCTLFVGTASNGNCSLNLNNSGAVAIKDSNGNVVTNMKADIPYNLCHNGSDFILQGKGGGGNLIPKYLLAGYYGEGDNGRVDGAMVNRGAPTSNLNCGGVVNLQEGYYAGGQIIANSLASQTGGATADDTKVLNGYKYWKDGVLRTGNATIQSLGGMPIEKYTFTKSTAYGTEEYFKFGSNIANTIYGKHIVIDVGNGYWTNIYADGVAKDYYLRSGSSSNTYGSGSAIKLLPDEDKVQFKMDKYTNVGVTIDLLVINIYI